MDFDFDNIVEKLKENKKIISGVAIFVLIGSFFLGGQEDWDEFSSFHNYMNDGASVHNECDMAAAFTTDAWWAEWQGASEEEFLDAMKRLNLEYDLGAQNMNLSKALVKDLVFDKDNELNLTHMEDGEEVWYEAKETCKKVAAARDFFGG